jgi:hypothetical protein
VVSLGCRPALVERDREEMLGILLALLVWPLSIASWKRQVRRA